MKVNLKPRFQLQKCTHDIHVTQLYWESGDWRRFGSGILFKCGSRRHLRRHQRSCLLLVCTHLGNVQTGRDSFWDMR